MRQGPRAGHLLDLLDRVAQRCRNTFTSSRGKSVLDALTSASSDLEGVLKTQDVGDALRPLFEYLATRFGVRFAIPNFWLPLSNRYVIEPSQAFNVAGNRRLPRAVRWLSAAGRSSNEGGPSELEKPTVQLLTELIARSSARLPLCITSNGSGSLRLSHCQSLSVALDDLRRSHQWRGVDKLPQVLDRIKAEKRSAWTSTSKALRQSLKRVLRVSRIRGNGVLSNLLVLRLSDDRWKYLWYFPAQAPGGDPVGGWLLLSERCFSADAIDVIGLATTLFFAGIAHGMFLRVSVLHLAVRSFRHMIPSYGDDALARVRDLARSRGLIRKQRTELANLETYYLTFLWKAHEVQALMSAHESSGMDPDDFFAKETIRSYVRRAVDLATRFNADRNAWNLICRDGAAPDQKVSGVFFSALHNLLSNIIRYAGWNPRTPARTQYACIWIRRHRKMYHVCVGNTGQSIKKDPFPAQPRLAGNEHGVGLYIARELVRQQRGEMRWLPKNLFLKRYPDAPAKLRRCNAFVEFTVRCSP